jgi:HEAT repeat protein
MMASPTSSSRDDLRARLAASQGVRGTQPDIELGQALAKRKDAASVAGLVGLLDDRKASSSALKALFECGYLAPVLLVPHAAAFFDLLQSKNNRLVWGGAIALSCVAEADGAAIWPRRKELMAIFGRGSVITRDAVVRALARTAASSPSREREIAPWLLRALQDVRPVNLPRWAEDILPVLSPPHAAQARTIVTGRLGELKSSAQRRLRPLLRSRTG